MGIAGLSRIVAMEGVRKNVRSNIIAPFAWTRMIASIPVKDEEGAKRVERMRTGMRADQVAQLAVTLCADDAKHVSGQIFSVRGNEVVLFSQPRPSNRCHAWKAGRQNRFLNRDLVRWKVALPISRYNICVPIPASLSYPREPGKRG